MADIQFRDIGDGGDRLNGFIVDPVPRVDLETQDGGMGGSGLEGDEFAVCLLLPAFAHGVAIGTGVQFDYGRAGAVGSVDLVRVGTDEQRHARPGLIQPADEGGDPIVAADDVEPTTAEDAAVEQTADDAATEATVDEAAADTPETGDAADEDAASADEADAAEAEAAADEDAADSTTTDAAAGDEQDDETSGKDD